METDPYFENLKHLYAEATEFPVAGDARIVIMSDMHLGDGSKRDDFVTNSRLFQHILSDYYLPRGYSLILNGDVEELHRFPIKKIRRYWTDVYKLFDEFNEGGRLYKTVGNHDIRLSHLPESERRYPLYRALRLRYGEDTIFVFHGHQASMFYEKHNDFTGLLLKYLAHPLRIRSPSVSHDSRKKFLIEKRTYEFSSFNKIVSIIGHTHRPLFESLSKIESLKFTIELLCRSYPSADQAEKADIRQNIYLHKEELSRLYRRRHKQAEKSTLYTAHLVVPCLFNSGSVVGRRGITSLEIEDGEIRLVHWVESAKLRRSVARGIYEPEQIGTDRYARVVLNRDQLEYVFTRIRLLT